MPYRLRYEEGEWFHSCCSNFGPIETVSGRVYVSGRMANALDFHTKNPCVNCYILTKKLAA
jgi:hypothetical protein